MQFKKFNIFLLAIILLAAVDEEADLFARISRAANAGNGREVETLSAEYLRRFSDRSRAPQILFIKAGQASSPATAIEDYKRLLEKWPDYQASAEARRNLCEILSLTGRWDDMRMEALNGLSISRDPGEAMVFRFYVIEALIRLNRLSRAGTECIAVTESSHESLVMSRALVMASHVTLRTRGMSRDYLSALRELATGFGDSPYYPSVLFLLGEFHEAMNDKNRALGAYTDLSNRFPRSPEALVIRDRVMALKKAGAVPASYIPDDESIKKLDTIDLRHDQEEDESRADVHFCISIGPLPTRARMTEIRRIAEKIAPCRTILVHTGFIIYCGRYASPDEALSGRIRLAEEYGINGSVVRLQTATGKQYIYGE